MNYDRIYQQLIDRARNRVVSGYVERHHIVPRCMDGSDELSNLVALTPEEHFLAHLLLVKMHPEHRDLIVAVHRMCKGYSRKSRKMYGWLKRRFSERMRELNSGEGNPNFGTQWIHRGLENKKIKKGDPIPEGWELGRKMKADRIVSNTACCKCGIDTGSKTGLYCKQHRKETISNNLKYAEGSNKTSAYRNRKASDDEIIAALRKFGNVADAMNFLGYKKRGYSKLRFQKLFDAP